MKERRLSTARPSTAPALWSRRMMRSRLFLFSALAALSLSPAEAAQPGFGQWAEGEQARVRLIAAGIGADGRLAAGIEIMLEPGWWTYWRTPGAAGIPPAIDLSGSANVGAVEVSFPLPKRHDDGYGVSNVYEGGVLLPIAADVPDPQAPVELRLSLDLGVCEEVCIPEHIEATLTIPPGMTDRVAAATLAGARARVPGRAAAWHARGRKRPPERWHRQASLLRHRGDRTRRRRNVRRGTGRTGFPAFRSASKARPRRPTGWSSTASARRRRRKARASASLWWRTGRRSSRSSPSTNAGL